MAITDSSTVETPAEMRIAELTHQGVMHIHGEDAEGFLQSQFINDLSELSSGQTQINGYCDAKGRLLAIFQLLKRAEHFFIIAPNEILPGLIKRLNLFVLRSKVTIEVLPWHIFVAWGSEIDTMVATLGELSGQSDETLKDPNLKTIRSTQLMTFRDDSTALLLLADSKESIVNEPVLAELLTPEAAWQSDRVRAGVPTIYQSTVGQFLPQWVNMDLIDGLSFRKGCFPGQEIIARTRYLGKLKKRMVAFSAQGIDDQAAQSLLPGSTVYDQDQQKIGTVVDAVEYPAGDWHLLAMVRLAGVSDTLLAGEVTLHAEKLPYPIPETTDSKADSQQA